MTLNNPKLTLTFLGGGTSSSSMEVDSSFILKESISSTFQLFSSLKSSSRQMSLALKRKTPAIESIIKTEGDIKAVLTDGSNTLFTGYLSTNYSWTLGEYGEEALSVTIEDNGSKLLGKAFIKSGKHLFKCTASNAIKAVADKAGISFSDSIPTIDTSVVKVVSEDETCKDVLSTMLYELGYVYYFENDGKMNLFSLLTLPKTESVVLDGTTLVLKGGAAVTLSKSIRQYNSSKIRFTELGTAEHYLIYRNTTDKDSSHQYCNLVLKANEAFDGAEIYTIDDSVTRTPTQIEAVNAESETERVGSRKIIAVENVEAEIEKYGSIAASITAAGGPYIKVYAENRTASSRSITRLDAYADILYEKSQNIVLAGDDTTSSDNTLEEELEYVHTTDEAKKHASLVAEYNKYSSGSYTFYSREDIPLGAVVRLNDDVFTGLDVRVLVYAKVENDYSGIIEYRAVGYSEFSFDKSTVIQRQLISPVKDMGAKGETGAKGEKGDTGATGAQGIQGIQGEKGEKGDTGAQGIQGIQGEKGEKGDTGAQGIQGIQGEKGEKGDTGVTGAPGPQGEKGDTGEKGDKGDTGAQGPKGDTGAQGPQGEKGDTGATGAKGADARTYVTLTSGYDLNSCLTKDYVYVSSSTAICNSLLNKPDGFIAGEVRVEVEWLGSSSYIIQRLYCKAGSNSKSFARTYSSGTFGSWVEQGEKGDKGDTGATGAKGDKGDKGDTGATGAQGPKGDTGAAGKDYWQTKVWLDLSASTYDVDTWYPVIGTSLSNDGYVGIKVVVNLNSGTKPSWSTHSAGFSVDFHIDTQRSGWGTTNADTIIYSDTYKFCTVSPTSYTQMTYGSIPVLYLRGGGKYYVQATYAVTWTIKPEGYTWTSGSYTQTVSPATTRPNPMGRTLKGDTGSSVTTIIQYLLSTSSTLTEAEQSALTTWVDGASLSWSYGYYIYKRTKKETVETGAISYTYHGRDTSLETYFKSQLSFSITSDRSSYFKNLRAGSAETTTIQIKVNDRYYSPSSINWTLNGSSFSPTQSSGLYSFTIPLKNPLSSYTVKAVPVKNSSSITGAASSLTLTVVDITESCKFFGAVAKISSAGSGEVLLDGDSCFLTTKDGSYQGNAVYVYQSGSWVEFNSSTLDEDTKMTILSKAQKAAFEYAESNELASAYGYFKTLVAKYIYARNIGVEDLKLEEGGVIRSGGYQSDGSNPSKTAGIYMSADGKVKMEDAEINGSFSNSKIDANETQTLLWSKALPFLYQDGDYNSIDEMYSKPAFIKKIYPYLVGSSTDKLINTKAIYHNGTTVTPIFVYNASSSTISAISAGIYIKYGYARGVIYNGYSYGDVYLIVVSTSAITESALKSVSYFANATFSFDTSTIESMNNGSQFVTIPDGKGANRVFSHVYTPSIFRNLGVSASNLPAILVEDVIYECTQSFSITTLDNSTVGQCSPYKDEVSTTKTLGKYIRLAQKDGILYYQFSADKTTWTVLDETVYFSNLTVTADVDTATITGKFNFFQAASMEVRDLRKANNIFDETGKISVYSLYSNRIYTTILRALYDIYTNNVRATSVNAGVISAQEANVDMEKVNSVVPIVMEGSNIGTSSKRFENVYAGEGNFSGTVAGATVSGTNVQGTTVKAGADGKVVIGQDNESGYVNIHNVDQGSSATFWHIDAWHNQLRFVRSGSTVPGYVDASGVWGAVFN